MMTKKLLKIFNEYLVNIFRKLGIVIKNSNIKLRKLYLDEVNVAITKYKNHTSIKAIKSRMGKLKSLTFNFNLICRKERP